MKFWKTNPILRLRTSARPSFESREISAPSSQYSPEVGLSRHPSMFISVLLPDPDAPVSATISPRSTVRFIPFNTGRLMSPIK